MHSNIDLSVHLTLVFMGLGQPLFLGILKLGVWVSVLLVFMGRGQPLFLGILRFGGVG